MSANVEINTILYATDLGQHMRPVFRHAVTLARKFGASIIMLHVVEPISRSAETMLSLYLPKEKLDAIAHEGMDEVIATMRQRLENYCRDEAEICAGDSRVSDLVVECGDASKIIKEQAVANGADLIVMGNCASDHRIGKGIIGSTARRVTQEAQIPVLIVPNCR
jgi:nucleotide-binding universal stress UspA family protein